MIVGYKRLKDIEPGTLFRFDDANYAVMSEYGNNAYLLVTGEAVGAGHEEEWVAIINLDAIEVEAFEEADYPPDTGV